MILANSNSLGQNATRRKLGVEINLSNIDELNPKLSSDAKALYFSRSDYKDNVGGEKAGQDIWVSYKDDNGNWLTAFNVGKPLNNIENNSIGSFNTSASKVYLANTYSSSQKGISSAVFSGMKFSKPSEVLTDKEIATSGFLSFSVTPDEKWMLLSMYTDAHHKEDLFVSEHLQGGWTKPKTLGKTINTHELELSPFLAKDGKTLFFASNGHGGFGDVDIFMSKRLDDSWTNWSTPKNLGSAINTEGFDAYFISDSSNTMAFFCSGDSAKSSADIYTIATTDIRVLNAKVDTVYLETNTNKKLYGTINKLLNKEDFNYFVGAKSFHCQSILEVTEQADFLDYIPQSRFFGFDTLAIEVCQTKEKLKCDSIIAIINVQRQSMAVNNIVTDASTGKPLPCFVVLNGDTLVRFKKLESTVPFEFACELRVFKKNKLEILQNGYMPATFMFDLTDSLNSFYYVNRVALIPLTIGNTIGLQNILFEIGKSIIKQESFTELDNLVQVLNRNLTMKIYVGGHTDNKGDEKINLKLSEERALSVVKYLNEKGIASNRLFSKGFGSSKPIATNETEEGRNMNRRVEFTITEK